MGVGAVVKGVDTVVAGVVNPSVVVAEVEVAAVVAVGAEEILEEAVVTSEEAAVVILEGVVVTSEEVEGVVGVVVLENREGTCPILSTFYSNLT